MTRVDCPVRLRDVLVACVLLIAVSARAELWTFVDGRGITHFASSKLDPRYAEFASQAIVARGTVPLKAGSGGLGPAGASAPVPLTTYFSGMPGYAEARLHLQAASEIFGVDLVLLQALVATESGFDTGAVSPKGAVGLMQVMPATAARYGLTAESDEAATEKLKNPSVNVNMGARYLRDLLVLFGGDRSLALAAYNAGEGAVRKAGNRIPDFKETQNYVKTVLQLVEGLGGPPVSVTPTRAPGANSVVHTIGLKEPPGRSPRTAGSGAGSGAGVEIITDRASAQSGAVPGTVTSRN